MRHVKVAARVVAIFGVGRAVVVEDEVGGSQGLDLLGGGGRKAKIEYENVSVLDDARLRRSAAMEASPVGGQLP